MKTDPKIKCVSCGKWATQATIKMEGVGVRGWKCVCGEEFLHPEDSQWLLLMNKTKHHTLTAKISKIGNSYSVRLPKEIVDLLKLKHQLLRITVGMNEIKLATA